MTSTPTRTSGFVAAAAVAGALLLAACSSGGGTAASSSAAASSGQASPSAPSAAASSTTAGGSESASPEEIFVSLCDKATPEQEAAIQSVMKPDYTVSQLSDVRTSEEGPHAILGFVEGPGLSVLAVWTGNGPTLEGLAAAEEFAAQASTATVQTPDAEVQKLVDATPECYSTLFAPQGDTGKKDKKNNNG